MSLSRLFSRGARWAVCLAAVVVAVALLATGARPAVWAGSAAQTDKTAPRRQDADAYLSNNLLRIYIAERQSTVWYYQYSPGLWGESNYHELFALYTPTGGIVESPSLTVDQPFTNPGGGPGSVSALLSNSQFLVQRTVTVPPDDGRYIRLDYDIINKSGATIPDARFFQAIDFDIPFTGDHTDDNGWYDATNDTIGVRDDQFFRNVLASVPHADRNSVDHWSTQIYFDWDDGNLSGRTTFGPGDPAVAKQFNLGSLSPNEGVRVTFYVWFGDPTTTGAACINGRIQRSDGAPLAGATVTALHQTALTQHTMTSNASGVFSLFDLAAGTYSLRISAPGYAARLAVVTVNAGCVTVNMTLPAVDWAALALLAQQHAPDIYQDTDAAATRADFFAPANFDGNWDGLDNWQNLLTAPQPAYVYWDAASTATHHFIKYYLFYPRDWGDVLPLDLDDYCTADGGGLSDALCHENDLEGFAIAINRTTGQVEYMVTRRHGLPPDKCEAEVGLGRPTNVTVQRMGHAVYCRHEQESSTFPGGDGVVYHFGGTAEVPSSHTDSVVLYDLIHVDALRAIVGTLDGALAYTPNLRNFRGDDWGANKASTPWALGFWWLVPPRAGQTGQTYAGDLYADPARLFATLFPTANIATDYTFNPNLTAAAVYEPSSAGWVTAPAGDVNVFLPFGAIDSAATVALGYDVPDDLTLGAARSGDVSALVGRPFHLSATRAGGGAVAAFNAPAQIVAGYSPADLAEMDATAADLTLARWDGRGWQTLPTQVDETAATAQAYSETPGVFALFTGAPLVVEPAALFLPIALVQPTPTPTDTPTATFTPTPTNTPRPEPPPPPPATPTPTAPACANVVANPSFEENAAWQINVNEFPAAYWWGFGHSGSRSMRIGIPGAAENRTSYSSVQQTVAIPSPLASARLGYWLYPQTSETVAALTPPPVVPTSSRDRAKLSDDAQMVLLFDRYGQQTVLRFMRENPGRWVYYEDDLSAFRGQTVTLYFGVFNNGWGGVTAMWADDVVLNVCR